MYPPPPPYNPPPRRPRRRWLEIAAGVVGAGASSVGLGWLGLALAGDAFLDGPLPTHWQSSKAIRAWWGDGFLWLLPSSAVSVALVVHRARRPYRSTATVTVLCAVLALTLVTAGWYVHGFSTRMFAFYDDVHRTR